MKRGSPWSVGSIEPDGILNGSAMGQRISRASATAMTTIRVHSTALSRVKPPVNHVNAARTAAPSASPARAVFAFRWGSFAAVAGFLLFFAICRPMPCGFCS